MRLALIGRLVGQSLSPAIFKRCGAVRCRSLRAVDGLLSLGGAAAASYRIWFDGALPAGTEAQALRTLEEKIS
jgi:hypothetical protein